MVRVSAEVPMKITALYRPHIVTADVQERLAVVASRMRWRDVSAVPVFDAGRLVGIITERDVVSAVADGANTDRVSAGSYMTPDPTTVGPAEDAADVAALMVELGVDSLPVVEGERVLGVVSAKDLMTPEAWHPLQAAR